jgi:DNA-binding transcriptional MerR regulator
MTKKHFLLKDVARRLGVKPYRVVYALTTGLVPEPSLRISNKRIFDVEDIERLAKHFGVDLKGKVGGKEKHGQ